MRPSTMKDGGGSGCDASSSASMVCNSFSFIFHFSSFFNCWFSLLRSCFLGHCGHLLCPPHRKKWGQLSNIAKARNQILYQDPIPGSCGRSSICSRALYMLCADFAKKVRIARKRKPTSEAIVCAVSCRGLCVICPRRPTHKGNR